MHDAFERKEGKSQREGKRDYFRFLENQGLNVGEQPGVGDYEK